MERIRERWRGDRPQFQRQLELRPTVGVVDYGFLPRPEMKAARVEEER